MTDSKKRILIIEDEKPMAKALSLKLEDEGYKVDLAADGEEGLNTLKENKYDLVFLDLIMPNKDGFEVLKQMKEDKGESRIVVLSNLSQKEDQEKALDMGADNFFIKSNISIAEIVEETKKILSE